MERRDDIGIYWWRMTQHIWSPDSFVREENGTFFFLNFHAVGQSVQTIWPGWSVLVIAKSRPLPSIKPDVYASVVWVLEFS